MVKRLYFCPRCHIQINVPDIVYNAHIKAAKGITITCGMCKKGKVTIFPPIEVVA